MIPGSILLWLGGNWRWLVPSTACLGLLGALWWANNSHALETAKSAAVIANLEASIAKCEAASAQAKADAEIARRNKETEYATKADDSKRSNDVRERVYAQKLQTRVHSSPANTSPTSGGAGVSEGSAAQTELATITISVLDAEICTENTAKLESAVEWVAGLNESPR